MSKGWLKTNIRLNIRKVRNFMRKSQTKEFLTFLFFLLLSFVFWILQGMNEETESTFAVDLIYKNVPENVVFTNEPASEVNFRIRDKGLVLFNYRVNERLDPIEIDFSQIQNTSGTVNIKEEQLINMIKRRLRSTSSIVAAYPDTVNLFYTQQLARQLPVKFNGKISSQNQSQIGKKIIIKPDSVKVYAPASILDTIQYISTVYTVFDNLADTTVRRVELHKIYGVKVVPEKVTVVIPVEEYTEKEIRLPIDIIGLPDSLDMRIFPSSVNVSFFVGLSAFKDISPDQFQLAVYYSELDGASDAFARVEIVRMPDDISNVRLSHRNVEYIIEQKEQQPAIKTKEKEDTINNFDIIIPDSIGVKIIESIQLTE